jgi:hypothetical protein
MTTSGVVRYRLTADFSSRLSLSVISQEIPSLPHESFSRQIPLP